MNNPYDNGKVMSPQMTLLAMVFEAGVRAATGAVREKIDEVAHLSDGADSVRRFLDEVDAMFPKPEEQEMPQNKDMTVLR